MTVILVVEQEKRYVERIVEALSPQGWEVVGVDDRDAALKHRQDETASLLIVNGEVPAAADLVQAFARSGGGPGAVVLVPEDADDGVHRMGADEVLQKPFTDQEIRLAVRRCLVGLSSPATGQVTAEPAHVETPDEPRRLTSEDLFGDMVSELESAFKIGLGEHDAEEAVEVEEGEPGVVEAVVEEQAPDEESPRREEVSVSVEAADEEEPVGPPIEEPAADEIIATAEIEPTSLQDRASDHEAAADEDDAVEAAAESSDLEAPADEEEAAAEPVEEVLAPEPPKPRRDPAAVLEERIRQAAEEGMRLAAKRRRRKASADQVDRSTESLLQKALQGIDEEAPRPRHPPARATEQEVEDLVGSVVDDGRKDDAAESAASAPEPVVAAIEVLEPDHRDAEEDEYRTRLRMIWWIVLLVVLVAVAVVVLSRGGDEASTGEPMAPSTEQQEQPVDEAPGAVTPENEAAPDAMVEDATDEDSLEQELEAQRRQLQEEIARSRAAEEDGP